jgi:hypothetical protein
MNNPNPRLFARGNQVKKGKASPGSGRTPDWLKAKCRAAAPKVIKFLIDLADGKPVERVIEADGKIRWVPGNARDRSRAGEMLMDRGYGKVPQGLEHSGGLTLEQLVGGSVEGENDSASSKKSASYSNDSPALNDNQS